MRSSVITAVLLAACASEPAPVDRALLRDPEGLHSFYAQSVAAGQFGDLYRVTEVDLSQEEFVMIFLNADMMRECIRDARLEECAVDGAEGTHRLVNDEFAFDRTFRVFQGRGGIWRYEFTDDDVEYLRSRLWGYYETRPSRYNGRRHVFPGGWRHSEVDSQGGR